MQKNAKNSKNAKYKKKALKKCDEPDCEMQFIYKKELAKHKSECHPRCFKCPDCDVLFKLKHHLAQHLLECKKIAKVHDCSKCSYSTFRKSDLERHASEMHHNPEEYFSSDVSVTAKPDTIVSNLPDMNLIFVSNERNIHVLGPDGCFGSKMKSLISFDSEYNVKSMESEGQVVALNGVNKSMIKKYPRMATTCKSKRFSNLIFLLTLSNAY